MTRLTALISMTLAGLLLCQVLQASEDGQLDLPYEDAGLSEREAAAFALERLTFGPRPGDVDRVLEMGLENWLLGQLDPQTDAAMSKRLEPLDALAMAPEEIVATFPSPGQLLRMAVDRGDISMDDYADATSGDSTDESAMLARRRQMMSMMGEDGYRPLRELSMQLMAQKMLRGTYSENQLEELLVDFWFNHFNVAATDNQSRPHVLSYERDAIRPHVLGDFRDMLGATASHPAMLTYLDNGASRAEEGQKTTLDFNIQRSGSQAARGMGRGGRGQLRGGGRAGGGDPAQRMMERMRSDEQRRDRNPNAARPRGLNENYARELMELHTLGVDGGYSQEDVVDVARAFTGWTYRPPRRGDGSRQPRLPPQRIAERIGIVQRDQMIFHPGFHDAEVKTVLGKKLPAGRGIEDGDEVLDLLVAHPSTAGHISRKLAIRFVSDEPPRALVDRLADTFMRTQGDIAAMMRTLVESPHFWGSRGDKIKSPFELAMASLRALDAEITHPAQLAEWIERMGQPLYRYQAPTGFPDEADFWVNSGALLNRMNFGLQLASGRIRGVEVDLAALNGGREPESSEHALEVYAGLLMPDRELDEALALLEPNLTAPDFSDRVDAAAPAAPSDSEARRMSSEGEMAPERIARSRERGRTDGQGRRGRPGRASRDAPVETGPVSPLAQVVGLIVGSPEFQRR